jgi:hypothetical protein
MPILHQSSVLVEMESLGILQQNCILTQTTLGDFASGLLWWGQFFTSHNKKGPFAGVTPRKSAKKKSAKSNLKSVRNRQELS